MNASWPMVIGALLAGTVGGILIPTRAEIRDVPAITASRTTEPAAKKVTATPAKADESADVRKVPLAEQTSANSQPAAEANAQAEAIPCERQAWPNQTPDCLDRSAKIAPAETVPARRIDPAVSDAKKPESRDELKAVATPAPAAPAPVAAAAPKPEPAAPKPEPVAPKAEPAKPQPKVASTPPAREEPAAQPEPAAVQPAREARDGRSARPARPQQTATRSNEPRAETAAEDSDEVVERPRRSTRRVTRDDLDDGIPTRIYLRGPDGRLYLAPEYRPSGRSVYIMR
jgi:hypothetical protein